MVIGEHELFLIKHSDKDKCRFIHLRVLCRISVPFSFSKALVALAISIDLANIWPKHASSLHVQVDD